MFLAYINFLVVHRDILHGPRASHFPLCLLDVVVFTELADVRDEACVPLGWWPNPFVDLLEDGRVLWQLLDHFHFLNGHYFKEKI